MVWSRQTTDTPALSLSKWFRRKLGFQPPITSIYLYFIYILILSPICMTDVLHFLVNPSFETSPRSFPCNRTVSVGITEDIPLFGLTNSVLISEPWQMVCEFYPSMYLGHLQVGWSFRWRPTLIHANCCILVVPRFGSLDILIMILIV